jgi:hypothetical protein
MKSKWKVRYGEKEEEKDGGRMREKYITYQRWLGRADE